MQYGFSSLLIQKCKKQFEVENKKIKPQLYSSSTIQESYIATYTFDKYSKIVNERFLIPANHCYGITTLVSFTCVTVLLLVLFLQMQQELNRSNIVQAQAQRERDAMERLMKKKQDDFFDKLEAIHVQLQAVEEEANLKMQEVEERCNRDIDKYKVRSLFLFFCLL